MNGEAVRVYDIEFVTIDRGFSASRLTSMLESANELGAQRLSVCGEDPDRSRFVSTLAELCDLAATFGIGVDLECMAWRQVSSFPEAVPLVKEVGRPNCGALVDALHLSRTGGSPADIRAVPSNLIGSAQLCDAPAEHPESQDAIIQEARSGRLPPGCGQQPLRELLAALPAHTAISVEVPMQGAAPPALRAQQIYAATKRLFESCHEIESKLPADR